MPLQQHRRLALDRRYQHDGALPDQEVVQVPPIGNSTFHRPDGGTVQVPETMFAPLDMGAGVVGTVLDSGGPLPAVTFLDADGDVTASYSGNGPVLSPDRSLLAYYDQDASQLVAIQADGGGTGPGGIGVPSDQRLEPVGFLDEQTVVSNVSTETSPLDGVRLDTFAGGSIEASTATPPWDLIEVTAVSQAAQLVAGYTEITDSGSCSAVYETAADEWLWHTCEYSFDHFSPDGRYLVGTVAYRDGEANPSAVILDARSGEVVHTYTARFISETVFEDDGHLLLNVRIATGAYRDTAILRCDLQGTCELTTDIVIVNEEDDAYSLPLQP